MHFRKYYFYINFIDLVKKNNKISLIKIAAHSGITDKLVDTE